MDCSAVQNRKYEILKSHLQTLLGELERRNKLLYNYQNKANERNEKKEKPSPKLTHKKSKTKLQQDHSVKQCDPKIETHEYFRLYDSINNQSEEMADLKLLNSLEERHSMLWHSITNLQEKLSQIGLHARDECRSSPQVNEKLLNLRWKCENMKCNIATKYRDILLMQSQHSSLNISNPSDAEYNKLKAYANRIAAMRNACAECKRHIEDRLLNLTKNAGDMTNAIAEEQE
ncbi:hypothetical protein PPYR_08980 [Photinus pyralis]|uniref:Uncharacterized protein n=1 Tax=Photinus pyralis TaxID=7054 RepID=A0A1Y1N3U2_PHOPY|nr:uncharacterized protein LOC116172744 [Photinus pyralis]KAB0797987.1 hypothetical protein PPYR_08980 [Photinus pyralis]